MTITYETPKVRIVFTLHGNVNEDRAESERKIVEHRVRQLSQ